MSLGDIEQLALARFFVAAWDAYTADGDEELQELIIESPFVDEHEITQEEHDAGEYADWEVGDSVYILNEIGENVATFVRENEPSEE